MKLVAAILFFGLGFCSIAFAQEYKLDSLFRVFENDIEMEQTYNEGMVVWHDDTRENFYLLMSISPIDTLVKFIDHPNPAIRCILFSGLLNKNVDDSLISQIADKYSNDTAFFVEMSTDIVLKWTVKDYMQLFLDYSSDSRMKSIDYEERLRLIREQFRLIVPGEHHGVLKKEEFQKGDGITCNLKNWEISSFFIHVKTNLGIRILKSDGNKITPAMKRKVGKLKSGDRIWIDEIKVTIPNGNIKNMGSWTLIIE